MSWDKLLSAVGDNQDAVSVINTLKESSEVMTTNYNKLEQTNQGLKTDLDKFKQGNTLVKSTLGLEQLNEDTLKEALSKYKGKGADEATLKELENYKNQINELNGKFDNEKQTYINEIRELKNGSVLADVISKSDVIKEAGNDVKMIVQSMMSYDENNNVVFKNEDGTTKFNKNNQPYTMQDAVNEVLEARPYLRSGEVKKAGSGVRESKSQPTVDTKSMNPTEIMKQGRK